MRKFKMRAIETIAKIEQDRRLIVNLPVDILPGEHHVLVIIDERQSASPLIDNELWLEHLPSHEIEPALITSSFRREDLYGDNGR